MARVLIEGSSTAYGLWGGESGGWADRLKNELMTDPDRSNYATVINLATPLREVGTIVETLPISARAYAGRSLARIGIFMVGTNESRKIKGQYSVPPDRFEQSVRAISDISHDFGFKPIFLGMTPIDESRVAHLNSEYTEQARIEYQDIVRKVAENTGATFIDIEAELLDRYPNPDMFLDKDGMHPSDLGHAAIHGIITPTVKETLREMRA